MRRGSKRTSSWLIARSHQRIYNEKKTHFSGRKFRLHLRQISKIDRIELNRSSTVDAWIMTSSAQINIEVLKLGGIPFERGDCRCMTAFVLPSRTVVGEKILSDLMKQCDAWESLCRGNCEYPWLKAKVAWNQDLETSWSSCSIFGNRNWNITVYRLKSCRSTVI